MLKKTIEYNDCNGVERKEDFYFNLTEATELGTHCALHHSYSPQEQKYLFRLDVFDQKEIRLAISQKAHHGEMDFSAFERIDNMLRLEVPYKALEPCKSHYRNLEKALKDIGKKAAIATDSDATREHSTAKRMYSSVAEPGITAMTVTISSTPKPR